MRKLIHEVHRRSLWQVLGIYLAASWVVLQVVHQLVESAGLPDWVSPFAIVLLLIGLPIVMATAFVQERGVVPDGPAEPKWASSAADGPAGPRPDPGTGSGVPGGTPAAGLLTWRNAILGGVLAFVLLVVVTGSFMFMRSRGIGPVGSLIASGVLDERSPVVLSTFESADPDLARAATEAFRVDLSQSPVVRLVDPAAVALALGRMELPPETRIDRGVASEIAQREGIPAVFAGEINAAGASYVVSAQLLAAKDGQVLASHRETAADAGSVVDAINRVSTKLREKIGESYTSLRASEPLQKVTTESLEALQKYTEAIEEDDRNMDSERAIALIEEAVAIDPEFAMAWRKLGVMLANREEQRGRSLEAIAKAYEFRDRLPDRERYLASAAFHDWVEGRTDLTIREYQNMLAVDPDDHWALNNLSVKYWQLGQFEKAFEYGERLIRADSSERSMIVSGAAAYDAGRPAIARERMDHIGGLEAPSYVSRTWSSLLALEESGDYGSFEDSTRAVAADGVGNPYQQARAEHSLAASAAVRGRLAEAHERLDRAERLHRERGRPPEALEEALVGAWLDLDVGLDAEAALAGMQRALERYPLVEIDPLERPYLELAHLYAAAGRPDEASLWLVALAEQVPAEFINGAPGNEEATLAEIARAEGRFDDALELARVEPSDGRRAGLLEECPLICRDVSAARTFDAAGQADSAAVYYGRYVSAASFARIFHDASYLARAYERLGQLHDELGDPEQAALYYARFVDLWEDADPELQPRVEAARARLEEIVRERG